MTAYNRPIRALLDSETDHYVHDESRRLGLPVSAIIRQALDARKASQRRAAEIDADMLANEGAC